MKCANCFHAEANHFSSVCSGSIECMCQKFELQELHDFAAMIEEYKTQYKSLKERCKFILKKIPPTRNANEKQFAKIYREIWYGFKIRKQGTTITTKEWDRMPGDDAINRAKRYVKRENEDLQTYSPKVIEKQTALFQALMEMAIEQK